MASLLQIGSALISSNALAKKLQRPQSSSCITLMAKATLGDKSHIVPRRSANYQPSLWDHHLLLSVENKYDKDKSVRERDLLKEKVRKMLDNEKNTYLDQLEFIDDLQKLGVSYHFETEIKNILSSFYQIDRTNVRECDLHATALEFRLLRQHGFNVSEDVFDIFMENCGKFDIDDINGFISLYEASYLSTKSDTKLQEFIRPFATQILRDFVDNPGNKNGVREMVVQALDMPYYWQMRRLATRWYIDVYGKRQNKNLVVVEFAKIDFNIVQAIHQKELKYVSSWWRETGLSDQLHFARDRIVENYFWTIGKIQEPQYGYVRRIMTKVNALLTTIDDIYDIYGTLEELQLFTVAFENWDVNRLDELPEYMRLCFLVVYNEVNSIGCDVLRNKNINVIPFLKKSWTDVCKAYLVEAKWYKRGHKPNLEEYMQNAWISISAPTIFIHFYCVFSDELSIPALETLSQHQQNVVRCSASVFRLANDLVTSPIGSPLTYNNALAKTLPRPQSFKWTTMAKMTPDESHVVTRRSANYQPSLWDHRHLLSIENKYAKDGSVRERDLLKEKVRKMLDDEKKTYLEQLELIDDLQKLGVSYHFEAEIENILMDFGKIELTWKKIYMPPHSTFDSLDNVVSMFQKVLSS